MSRQLVTTSCEFQCFTVSHNVEGSRTQYFTNANANVNANVNANANAHYLGPLQLLFL